MKYETSAGGIVICGNAVLLLKKYNGDWVLPKGKVERKETIREAASREVFEETLVKAETIKYLGAIHYVYQAGWAKNEKIYKTVHWFLMKSKVLRCTPLKREGFVDARYVHRDRVMEMVRYPDEQKMIYRALQHYEKNNV
ncbi:MAG: NUDIX hydrolase [Tindallia sp. MSAO_Bac2]|nr:MAG: NUDIX hydrolase [Tindallia sp. MSAO_Bac2]